MEPDLSAYLMALQEAANRQEADITAMQTSVNEVARVRQLVTRLPEKVRHKAMVPYGKHAFFPGELIHTNEFLVGLGCDLQLEASAVQAAAVLQRRQGRAEAAVAAARQQLEELQARVRETQATLSNEEGEAFMEIRQDYEESEKLLRSARRQAAAAVGTTAAGPEGAGVVMQPGRAAGLCGQTASAAHTAAKEPLRGMQALGPVCVPAHQGNGTGARGAVGAGGRAAPGAPGANNSSSSSSHAVGSSPASPGGGEESVAGPESAAEDDEDRRIFDRLAELERLEAEAGSGQGSGDEDEGEGAREREGGSKGPNKVRQPANGAEAQSAAGRPAASPTVGAVKGLGESDHVGADGASTTVGRTQAGTAGSKQASKGKAGGPFRKGFLLGGGSGGSAARQGQAGGKAAAAATAVSEGGVLSTSAPRQPAAAAVGGGVATPAAATEETDAGSAEAKQRVRDASGGGGTDAAAPSGSPRQRRVSFADGSVPGMVEHDRRLLDDTAGSQRRTSGPSAQLEAGSRPSSVVKPALKQGTSRLGHEGASGVAPAQAGAECTASSGAGGVRGDAGRVAALEEGGDDVAMQMARAREAAFTGVVCERVLDGAAAEALGAGSSGAAERCEEILAQPKRLSKFKQQRIGGP